MKLAIATQGPDLNAPMDREFGRSHYFLIVDADTHAARAVPNPYRSRLRRVGVHAAELMAEQHVDAVVAGEFDTPSRRSLAMEGIAMIPLEAATALEALQRFDAGSWRPSVGSVRPRGVVGTPAQRK